MPGRRFALIAALLPATVAPALARWPDGVLNYCGYDGVWDEAGWRDTGWMQGGTEGMSFDREVKRFGRASLRIVGAEGETRTALQLSGNAIERGKHYVLRVWVKTDNAAGEAAVALQPHAEGRPLPFVELGEASRLKGTHDWTLVQVPVPDFPPDAVRMYPYVWVKGTGTAWFDEFSLAEEGVEVPLGGEKPITEADYGGVRFEDASLPANLIPNAGFEDGLAGWYTEVGKPQIDERVAAEGERSLRYDGFAECRYVTVAVHVRLDPRRAYRISVKLRTALTTGLSCVRLIAFRANGEGFGWWHTQDHTSEFLYGRGTRDWHEESLVLRGFPAETDFVNVYLELEDAVGRVWFDDVRLTPLSLAGTKEVRAP
jgi:hypothetical protein